MLPGRLSFFFFCDTCWPRGSCSVSFISFVLVLLAVSSLFRFCGFGYLRARVGSFPPLSPVFPLFFLSFVVTKSIAFSTSIHVGRLTVLPLFYGERSRRVVSERERVALGHNIVPTLSIVMETPHSMVVRG